MSRTLTYLVLNPRLRSEKIGFHLYYYMKRELRVCDQALPTPTLHVHVSPMDKPTPPLTGIRYGAMAGITYQDKKEHDRDYTGRPSALLRVA